MLRHLQKILHGFDFVYIVCVLLLMFYCVLIILLCWFKMLMRV